MLAAAFTSVIAALIYACDVGHAPQPPQPGTASAPAPDVAGEERIITAFRDRLSDIMVETDGVVARLLPDDNHGSRHQRFILRLSSGHTVLVSHNIDLAPRIDGLRTGDTVQVRGEYEWNSQGGVIHWTHHDPKGRHPGGWIRHQSRVYE